LRNLQRRGAFFAAFTSEKLKMTIKKSLLKNGQMIPNIFTVHLPILVQFKTMLSRSGLDLMRNWQLGA
jgi:hypothetical protein